MELQGLLDEVLAALPQGRRKALDDLVAEYGAGRNFHFLLAMAAAANRRERRVLRLLINQLERLPEDGEGA